MNVMSNNTLRPPGLDMRVKGVAATRPLHDLDTNKSSWPGDWWDNYDLIALAVATIDHVAIEMGVTSAATLDEVAAFCAGQAARQHRAGDPEHHVAVARRVVDGLAREQPFVHAWVDADGIRRDFEFRLLYEEFRADGEIVVRATPAAINVLVDAFGDDIESAQAASEAQMRELIKRGALEQAANAATTSRLLTAGYIEQIASITRDTLLDPDSVDWLDDVPRTLTAALEHIVDRVGVERDIAGEVEERRDQSDDPDVRMHANRTIARLRECVRLHGELQRHLISVRDDLRAAQDERFRQPAATRERFDADTMLDALWQLPASCAEQVADAVFAHIAGIAGVWLGNFATLVDDLSELRPVDEPGEPIEEPEFDDPVDSNVWGPYWEIADELIEGVTDTTTLADLTTKAVAAAYERNLDVDMVVSAACHRAYERLIEPFDSLPDGTGVVVAARTGRRLDDSVIYGDDIVLIPAILDPHTDHSDLEGAAT